jgi:hypothetical protein
MLEYYNASGDFAAGWVGIDGANRRLYFDRLGATVGIKNNGNEIADKYYLGQNYPNPFNPMTKIDFSIPESEFVTLKVFDILGREAASLVNQDLNSGVYTVDFDGTKLASGIYLYALKAGNYFEVKRMVLVK